MPCRTSTTRFANQHWFRSGSHSAASLPLFCVAVHRGDWREVRFSRSEANRRFVAASTAQRPLSWASERATMCSMSVSDVLVEPRSRVRAVDDAAHARDDARLDGLRVAVVVGVVRSEQRCSGSATTSPRQVPVDATGSVAVGAGVERLAPGVGLPERLWLWSEGAGVVWLNGYGRSARERRRRASARTAAGNAGRNGGPTRCGL